MTSPWLGSRGPSGSSRTLGPNVAGSWYAASPSLLAAGVDALLRSAPPAPASAAPVVALVEPHAGFDYSGEIAAAGFRCLEGSRFGRVLLIGPSHYVPFLGAALPDADAYRTPLGPVPLDLPALDSVRGLEAIRTDNEAFRREHSLEAEIPFLQRLLEPGWRLCPVLIGGGSSGEVARAVARSLATLLEPGTLVVASSDFTHFGPRFGYEPFREEVEQKLRELDLGAVRLIEARDAEGLEAYLGRTGATVCGRDAIGVLLRMLPETASGALVAYDTSGRITGDWTHSVSYASIVFREAR